MRMVKRLALVATSVVVPLIAAHALSLMTPEHGIGISVVFLLEALGFALVIATLRPPPLLAVLAAFLYFPLMFLSIFLIGVSAGYYDFP
jgi:hypothetical protein